MSYITGCFHTTVQLCAIYILSCYLSCLHINYLPAACTCTCTYRYMYMYISVFDKLMWRTIGPKSFLFGTAQYSLWASGAVNYDYIVTNNIKSLLIGSRCIPNDAHTNHC